MNWYYKIEQKEVGPISTQALKSLAQAQQISPITPIRRDNDDSWRPASSLKSLFAPVDADEAQLRSALPAEDELKKQTTTENNRKLNQKIKQAIAFGGVVWKQGCAALPSREYVVSTGRQIATAIRTGLRSFSRLEKSGQIVAGSAVMIAILVGVVIGRGCQHGGDKQITGDSSVASGAQESTTSGFSLFGRPALVVDERTDIPWPQVVDIEEESDWGDEYRNAAWISQSTLWKNRPPMRIEVQADANFLAEATLEQLTEMIGKQLRSSGVTVDDSSPVTATVRLRLSTGQKTTTENGRVIKKYPIHCCSVAVLIGAKLPLLRESGFIVSHVDLAYATVSEAYAGPFELANSISDAIDAAVGVFDSGIAQTLPIKGSPLTKTRKTNVRPEWRADYFRGAMGRTQPSRALTAINTMKFPEITLDKIASERFPKYYVENAWKAAAPETNLTFNAASRVWATHEILVHEGYLNGAQRSLVRMFSSVPNYYGAVHIVVIREPVVFQYRGQMVWTNGCTYTESTRDLSLPQDLRGTLESGAQEAVRKFTSLR